MRLNVCSVRDAKLGTFAQPFFMMNDAAAVRAFGDLVRDSRTMVAQHPNDFVLFCLGSFDDAGQLNPEELGPRHVIDALSMVVKEDEVQN